jgi:hypothetical protein
METSNLAIVFGPTLLRPPGTVEEANALMFMNMNSQNALVESLIIQHEWIFNRQE